MAGIPVLCSVQCVVGGMEDEGVGSTGALDAFWRRFLAACRSGEGGRVRRLVVEAAEVGVDVGEGRGVLGMPLLHEACARGSEEVVRALIEVPGVDADREDRFGVTPLFRASANGHVEVVRLLQAEAPSGVDVNRAVHGESGSMTALGGACWWAHSGVVEFLLGVPGIEVNLANAEGETPLILAATTPFSDNVEVVRALLKAPGIDVNAATSAGTTALQRASEAGRVEVVKALLKVPGIDVNRANEDGKSALFSAVEDGHVEVVAALLAAPGIDVFQTNAEGETPFDLASSSGCDDVVSAVGAAERRMVGAMILALVYGGVPRQDAAELAIRGLGDGIRRERMAEVRAAKHL